MPSSHGPTLMKLGEGHNQGISEIHGQFQKHLLKTKVDFDIKSTRGTTFFFNIGHFWVPIRKICFECFLGRCRTPPLTTLPIFMALSKSRAEL